jgi:hypothetical protein
VDYKEKYLKYRIKYLSLKNKIIGGENDTLKSRYPKLTTSNIYYMGSHGCDTDEELDVPKGCIYVTFAECSFVNYVNDSYFKFLEMFSKNDILLKDPINNLEELQKILGKNLHIHYPEAKDPKMQKYFNNNYDPFLGWDNEKDGCSALKSGLYSIGTNVMITEDDSLKYLGTKFKFKKLSGTVEEKDINYLYKDSLYPTLYDLFNVNRFGSRSYPEFKEYEKMLFGVDQKTLFEYFPGIHYNLACRVDCRNHHKPSPKHLLRRQESSQGDAIERGFLPYDEKREGIFYFLKKGNLEKVKELVNDGLFINELNVDGKTPINVFCNKENFNLAKLLVRKGAIIDQETYQMCMKSGDRELFELLVTANVERLKSK